MNSIYNYCIDVVNRAKPIEDEKGLYDIVRRVASYNGLSVVELNEIESLILQKIPSEELKLELTKRFSTMKRTALETLKRIEGVKERKAREKSFERERNKPEQGNKLCIDSNIFSTTWINADPLTPPPMEE